MLAIALLAAAAIAFALALEPGPELAKTVIKPPIGERGPMYDPRSDL